MSKKTPSQAAIAKHLGVSQALVSMVLNGRKEGISPTTFDRIWNYAITAGYTPKGMKVDHVSGGAVRRTAIGYFLRSPFKLATKTNFFSHVTQGLHDYASENDLNLIFLGPESDADDRMLRRVKETLPTLRGLVILGEIAPEFQSFVDDMQMPTVIVSSRATGIFHSVNSNEVKAAQLLTHHLFELGHRQFAFLGGLAPKGRYLERREAVIQSFQQAGVDPARCRFIEEASGADRAEGFKAADQLIRECAGKDLPTAWIVGNGTMARGVCSRLFQQGIKIGGEVSVAAIDMTRVCWEEIPTLTSASAIPEDLGWEAGRLLIEAQQGDDQPLQDIVLPVKLVVRDSTGPAPVSVPTNTTLVDA
ncbi:LacI family transcriptional regulator [Puniceicoccales bacterium CK1056]|uniref:LacI family transcriptional regulator n=1 Tax=Oceanipulchritudo coccoides TaxID=2706888 RepID=A0A6B2M383_9BACT|nr:LacI family DNA-binding transcriptional regulator [Oceanipulchritudo coccoides]NDV63418.1 LacI family transcriptional regulator [Oceanipulchritudo coccoides]